LKQKISQYELMTTTPVPRLVVKLSIPTVISMLVTTIYNMVDTAFVGHLGNSASGAVGFIAETGSLAGAGFHIYLMSMGNKRKNVIRRKTHTIFVVLEFFGGSDDHIDHSSKKMGFIIRETGTFCQSV